ncbi:MAG: amidohydrolase family protein [Clostridia bacterium]|nr:amidohydrolase family protein [Clostridia bacterium]
MKVEMEIELPEYRIYDMHAHFPVSQDDWLRDYNLEYERKNGPEKLEMLKKQAELSGKDWREDWCFPDPGTASSDFHAVADAWALEVDRYHLGRVVFLTGGGNELLAGAVNAYPDKFIGFAHHSIEDADSARQLEYAVRKLGLKGYKLLAPLIGTPLSDPRFDDVWSTAESLGIPVLIHFGILGGGGGISNGPNISPLSIHDVAKRYPKLPIIVPHFGCGYVFELLQLCWACDNVFVDTSGNNEWIKWVPWPFTLESLFEKYYETVGPGRIIFGTDSEWFPRGFCIRYLLDQLRACRRLNMP